VRWIVLAVCITIGLGCYRLGIWQLDRLSQRRALNAQITDRTAQAPIELQAALALADAAYRPVTAQGIFDPDYAIYLTNRARDEQPGMHVVAPLHSDDQEPAILVDLGWVAFEEAENSPPSAWIPSGTVSLRGILRSSQTEPRFAWLADPTPVPGAPPRADWRVLYLPGLQAQTPYPLAPYYLAATEPVTSGSSVVPAPDIDLSEGPHLSYAIQWFAFGTTAIVGGTAWVRSVRRRAV
jgi:surfeit locus 1 family protein